MSFTPPPILLPDAAATAALGAKIAPLLVAGDTILLSGDIGAGKSCFARGLIRALIGADEDVPSPTFTLVQIYDAGPVPIWHCDLYRLDGPEGVTELGLDAAFDIAICLIEWPDRLGDLAPPDALHLHLTARDTDHLATVSGAAWATRLGVLFDPA